MFRNKFAKRGVEGFGLQRILDKTTHGVSGAALGCILLFLRVHVHGIGVAYFHGCLGEYGAAQRSLESDTTIKASAEVGQVSGLLVLERNWL